MRHKLPLESISGNSRYAESGNDDAASAILYAMGFHADVGSGYKPGLYIGARPAPGQAFFVYYNGPLGDTKEGGSFRLVRVGREGEYELDAGQMSLGHYNQGTTPTYYAGGFLLAGYSFHFRFTVDEAKKNALETA